MDTGIAEAISRKIAIISGGQTGVDRAALDVALKLKIPCGGWCPKGRLSEDGGIPKKYPLREASSERYDVRTRLNVQTSSGTLILFREDIRKESGTAYTKKVAEELAKPLLTINLNEGINSCKIVSDWILKNSITILNIAGPRESQSPGIYSNAYEFLLKAISPFSEKR